MAKPCGLAKPNHLVKPVSATRVAGRYLTHQQGLPHLPVPPLQQTCERYITALEPIVEVEELKHTKELVQEFKKAGGVGERLQKGLEKRAANTENWVSAVTPATTVKAEHISPVCSHCVCLYLCSCQSGGSSLLILSTGCLWWCIQVLDWSCLV